MSRIRKIVSRDAVLSIAAVLAVGSSLIVGVDAEYFDYIDYDTLIVLFCLMATVEGLRSQGLFEYVASRMLKPVKNRQTAVLLIIVLGFFSSMFITNDVALITFVPFAFMIIKMTKMECYSIPIIVLLTIAANLGSMLLPMGNPQNIYLFNLSGLSFHEFVLLMIPFAIVSLCLLTVITLLVVKREKISYRDVFSSDLSLFGLLPYFILFALCVMAVAGMLAKGILLTVVFIAISIANWRLLLKVDYGLLLTFVCFFIFVGNINRFDVFRLMISTLLSGHELIMTVGLSQMISNVPCALLLSQYSDNIKALIVGSNLGGLGTLVASMASIISYKLFLKEEPKAKMSYLKSFTFYNLLFLLVLLSIAVII